MSTAKPPRAAAAPAAPLLGRAAILAASDLPTDDVAVPEWGGTVRVRSMTAFDLDGVEASVRARRAAELPLNLRAHYAAACIVGEDGVPLFTVDDIEALGAKSGIALDRVYDAIVGLNRIAASDIETAAKNS